MILSSSPSILFAELREIRSAVGAEEFVVFDHGGRADASRWQRLVDADHPSREADSDGIGKRHVGWEGQGYFEFGSGAYGMIQVEEDSAGADVLGLGVEFRGAFAADNGRQAHIEAPHHSPFLCVRLHGRPDNGKSNEMRA